MALPEVSLCQPLDLSSLSALEFVGVQGFGGGSAVAQAELFSYVLFSSLKFIVVNF